MATLLEKPEPPGDYDCCESACEPCVWDFYYEELAAWQKQQQELKAAADGMKDDDGDG
ncbi:MAG: hypothetical protein GXZ05_04720 [Gammaproteobacteria bacterium]|jgi:hypothetical protein|nr:hypothetical protein [Gammaproteobacteria bacterium]